MFTKNSSIDNPNEIFRSHRVFPRYVTPNMATHSILVKSENIAKSRKNSTQIRELNLPWGKISPADLDLLYGKMLTRNSSIDNLNEELKSAQPFRRYKTSNLTNQSFFAKSENGAKSRKNSTQIRDLNLH